VHVDGRVLIVEADAPLRRSLEKFLDQAGYAFESCSTASDALVLAGKLQHDVVILGYQLPDASCPSLIEKLRLLHPQRMIIVISKYDFHAISDALARVKIDLFLQKPFGLDDFEAALSSAFQRLTSLL